MYTSKVTEKGMITIPIEMRRKLKIVKGDKVEFLQTEEGMMVVPIPRFMDLFGSDPSMREIAKAIHEGRRQDIDHESTE